MENMVGFLSRAARLKLGIVLPKMIILLAMYSSQVALSKALNLIIVLKAILNLMKILFTFLVVLIVTMKAINNGLTLAPKIKRSNCAQMDSIA